MYTLQNVSDTTIIRQHINSLTTRINCTMKIICTVADNNTVSSSDPLRKMKMDFYSIHWIILHIHKRKGATCNKNFPRTDWSGS